MRIVGELQHPDCKITIFSWNNKYLIKLEQSTLEQTFKINEYDIIDEGDLKSILDETFMHAAIERFRDMQRSLNLAMGNL